MGLHFHESVEYVRVRPPNPNAFYQLGVSTVPSLIMHSVVAVKDWRDTMEDCRRAKGGGGKQ